MSLSGRQCRFHPDRESTLRCEKFDYGYCRECVGSRMACTDPKLYCRHRTCCLIWELGRKRLEIPPASCSL